MSGYGLLQQAGLRLFPVYELSGLNRSTGALGNADRVRHLPGDSGAAGRRGLSAGGRAVALARPVLPALGERAPALRASAEALGCYERALQPGSGNQALSRAYAEALRRVGRATEAKAVMASLARWSEPSPEPAR
jgi:hypothetical protein